MKDEKYYQDTDERIERFMKGEMTSDEESDFKQELRSDNELRSRAMAMAALVKGVKKKYKEQDELIIAENNQTDGLEVTSTAKRRTSKKILWISGIAAMLVVAFGLYFIERKDPTNSLFDDYYTEYSPAKGVRGVEDSVVVAELDKLYADVADDKNAKKAMVRLEELYSELDNDITYRMYENDIAWYLALAYIKNNKIDKAKAVLEKIVADNADAPIAERAKKLLNEFK